MIQKLKDLRNQLIVYEDTLNIPSDVTFGFEIEVENVEFGKLKSIVENLKQMDSSFGEYKVALELSNASFFNNKLINGEISTGILTNNKKDWENLKKILNILKKEDAIITKRCGCHINIGTQILGDNENYWRNFLLLWKLYEDEIFKFSTGEYKKIRSYTYINPIASKLNIDDLLKIYGDASEYLKNLPNFLFNREQCCWNSLSLKKCTGFEFKKNNVIELRTPNGTLDLNVDKNYLYFFVKFLMACKKDLDIEKIVYDIENNNHSIYTISELLFDNELDKNNFLIQALNINKKYKKKLNKHIYPR